MRGVWPKRIACWLAGLACLAGSGGQGLGQRLYEEVEPQLFRNHISAASLGIYTEGEQQHVDYVSGLSSTYRRLFEGPLLGLDLDGSVYHPNLLQYTLHGDGSLGWTQERTTASEGPAVNRNEYQFLGNFNANVSVLANKPYRVDLFAASGHTFTDYDFFNRVQVDTFRYGMNAGYREGPVPVNVSVTHLNETDTGTGFENQLEETILSFDAHNDRPQGRTVFTYNLDDFTRHYSTAETSGTSHALGLGDTETFGARKNIEWRNNGSYTKRDFTDSPGDVWTAGSHLSIEHREDLWSMYDADYLRDRTDPTLSENADVSAAVRHQLFASLTSGLRFQVIHFNSEAPGSSFESTQYIGTWSESYTKRLSDSTHLTVGGSLGLTHTDQKSTSTIQIVGEAHTFGAGGAFLNSFFLNVLNVNPATIEVFNQGRTIHYTRDLDYTVQVIGAKTVLQLITSNPSGLTPTTPVVVDYEAAPQGSGGIDGLLGDAQIRLDMFHNLWGIYARYNEANYTAATNIVVQDISSVAFGTDVSWKWLRAGFEYEIYDSTFAAYTAGRLFQTLSFTPDEVSTLSLSLAEGWTDYRTSTKASSSIAP